MLMPLAVFGLAFAGCGLGARRTDRNRGGRRVARQPAGTQRREYLRGAVRRDLACPAGGPAPLSAGAGAPAILIAASSNNLLKAAYAGAFLPEGALPPHRRRCSPSWRSAAGVAWWIARVIAG